MENGKSRKIVPVGEKANPAFERIKDFKKGNLTLQERVERIEKLLGLA